MAKKKILLVDDEAQLVEMLKMRLEVNGYEVAAAHDGTEALKKVIDESPDLIILDIMLPKVDGFRVCRMLKADERYRTIPVLLLTALASEEDREAGRKAMADGFIAKPFSAEELIERVASLLSRPARPSTGGGQ